MRMENKKIESIKNKKKLTLLIFTILFLIVMINLIVIVFKISNLKQILAYTEIEAFFIISDHHGFAIEDEFLHFGMVMPGGGTEKDMKLYALKDKPVLVHINYSENIAPYMQVSKNDFILYPEELNKSLVFRLTNTTNTAFGNYTGTIYIYYLKP